MIDGRGGNDELFGNAGNDTFVFVAGQANGDSIDDFAGNGASLGDDLMFVGYGTLDQGVRLPKLILHIGRSRRPMA